MDSSKNDDLKTDNYNSPSEINLSYVRSCSNICTDILTYNDKQTHSWLKCDENSITGKPNKLNSSINKSLNVNSIHKNAHSHIKNSMADTNKLSRTTAFHAKNYRTNENSNTSNNASFVEHPPALTEANEFNTSIYKSDVLKTFTTDRDFQTKNINKVDKSNGTDLSKESLEHNEDTLQQLFEQENNRSDDNFSNTKQTKGILMI